MGYGSWAPYVPVAKRREKAIKKMAALRKKGKNIQPVEITGNKIAKNFWGKAWCEHLEHLSDYANRLPRGRTYARNGSVCHLDIQQGKIEAFVSGSSLYNINITISPVTKQHWQSIKNDCAGQISSILDLLQGKVSDGVMAVVSNPKQGLLPQPKHIKTHCDCPDGAAMCKHIAAVLYGVGARLDAEPHMLFLLRGLDHQELVSTNINLTQQNTNKPAVLGDLSDIFGIELDDSAPLKPKRPAPAKKATPQKSIPKQSIPKKATPKSATPKQIAAKNAAPKNTAPTKPRKKRAFSITAKGIARMRKTFAMNYSQYARLIGVSPATIKNWEAKDGPLNLKAEKLARLEELKPLNKVAAQYTLDKIDGKNR